MQNDFKSKDIEFALYVLRHPECVKEREVQDWLELREHRELMERLRCFREAGMREAGWIKWDEERQWFVLRERVISRKKKRQVRLSFIRYVAAIAVLVTSVSLFVFYQREHRLPKEKVLSSRVEEQGAVKLITGKGKEYVLASSMLNDSDTLSSQGMIIDSVGGVKYMKILQDTTRPDEFHTIQVPRGGEYILILDDGTRVWMNSESELRYPVSFHGSERRVYLKGEAYFEVKHDEEHPFVVETRKLSTRVLGTEFNVQSYENEDINVTLVQGSVAVAKNTGDAGEVVLEPGENALLDGDSLRVEAVDVLKYISWKEGFFYYNNVRLEDILDELGRWFDFTVFYANEEVKDYRFKFWANRKDSVEQVLARLNETGKLKIEVKGKTVVVSL